MTAGDNKSNHAVVRRTPAAVKATAAFAALTLGYSAPALAQIATPPAATQTPVPTADEVKKALDARRDELKSTLDKAGAIEQDVAKLAEERGKINQRLQDTASLIQASESKLTGIENRLGELEIQEKMIRGSLAQRQGQISSLLAALQRMGRNPPPVIVTKRQDALEMVRSAMLLAAAFPRHAHASSRTRRSAKPTHARGGREPQQGRAERAENTRLNDLKTQLAGLMETKRRSILERQNELRQVRDSANEISKSVSDLNDLIAKLEKTVQDNTGLGAYNAEVRAAEASPSAAPAVLTAPSGSASSPAQTAPEATEVVVMAPVENAAITVNPGRIKPATPFPQAKGKLPIPVSGKRVLNFGERTQYGSQSKGLVMETRSAAQVTSPCDGWCSMRASSAATANS